jgi:hypothetical protein
MKRITVDLLGEGAEIKKQRFISMVGQLASLRDLQYERDMAPGLIEDARKVVALNLPSNILRAAAIFVDFYHGFPASEQPVGAPNWVSSKKLLPQAERGSLVCTGFKDVSSLGENEVVVLLADIPSEGLHAGMAGIVRQLPSESEDDTDCLVEFGEPEDCISHTTSVSRNLLRRPRPGDLLENYRT